VVELDGGDDADAVSGDTRGAVAGVAAWPRTEDLRT
jgi:hypothetical protein